jgi:Na+:H+ antiporter, NhaA family
MNNITFNRKFIVPVRRIFSQSSSSAIILLIVTIIALIIANSPIAESFQAFWNIKIGFSFGDFKVYKPLILWINDGLMSVFFFVVGLELKREIVSGELSNPKNAIVPFVAGLGGMAVPALIYFFFNSGNGGEALNGWGIPMATDIAFALGVLYLLGPRVPISLKVFLTALAIIDDLGAVSVIAFFYTSDISLFNLGIGALFLMTMAIGNWLGIRSTLFFGTLGIAGLWLAFLLSGVHATIAAVLAAFTIPANYKISKYKYIRRCDIMLNKFSRVPVEDQRILNDKQYNILYSMERITDKAIPPLQKLEHSLHNLVVFLILPIFALANAGVSFSGGFIESLTSNVTMGVAFGLLIGKIVGIVGFVFIAEKIKLLRLPEGINYKLLFGVSCLAAIGFTMSLFITSLAFESDLYDYQAKVGILIASLIAGLVGYAVLNRFLGKNG